MLSVRRMSYVGAIDQGTTSTRFILFSKAGDIVSSAQKPFKQWLPEEGRTEHDPDEIWATVEWCVTEALKAGNPKNTTGEWERSGGVAAAPSAPPPLPPPPRKKILPPPNYARNTHPPPPTHHTHTHHHHTPFFPLPQFSSSVFYISDPSLPMLTCWFPLFLLPLQQISLRSCTRTGAPIPLSAIDSVGITNQRETTVVWDARTGKPLYRALVWMDMRSEGIVNDIVAADTTGLGQDMYRAKTGLPVSPYFSGTKLTWLLRNVPGLRALAEQGHAKFGTIDAWLLWKLSNGSVHATDVTNASRTLLMDIKTLEWDAEQCAAFGVPMQMLPEIRASSEVYCGGRRPRPLAGVRIAGILGDQQAALFGQAGMDPGASGAPTARDVSLCVMSAKSASSPRRFAFNGCVQAGSQPKSPRRVRA